VYKRQDQGIVIERGTPEHFFDSPESERVKHFLRQINILYGYHEELIKEYNEDEKR